jgi:thiol-disulfide isomerase/thioredoxin
MLSKVQEIKGKRCPSRTWTMALLVAALTVSVKIYDSARSSGLKGGKVSRSTSRHDFQKKAPPMVNAGQPVEGVKGSTSVNDNQRKAPPMAKSQDESERTMDMEQSDFIVKSEGKSSDSAPPDERTSLLASNASTRVVHRHGQTDQRFKEITLDNFKHSVEDSQSTWVVEFYSGYCDACTQFAPTFEKFATQLQEKADVRIGKVDIDQDQGLDLAMKLNAIEHGVPTIRIFSKYDKVGKLILSGTDADFPDGATASSLEQKALLHLQSL